MILIFYFLVNIFVLSISEYAPQHKYANIACFVLAVSFKITTTKEVSNLEM